MNYTEQTTAFACAGETLLGILAEPQTPAHTGVVVVVGGPQYRVGSHRQFVLLSRALAAAGFADAVIVQASATGPILSAVKR